MTIYRQKNRLTINAENAGSPEEALSHVHDAAAQVLGRCRLVECAIRRHFASASYRIEATFEEKE